MKCPHLWILDHEKYFNINNCITEWDEDDEGWTIFYRVFPAKCYMCAKEKSFTNKEWLEHMENLH